MDRLRKSLNTSGYDDKKYSTKKIQLIFAEVNQTVLNVAQYANVDLHIG